MKQRIRDLKTAYRLAAMALAWALKHSTHDDVEAAIAWKSHVTDRLCRALWAQEQCEQGVVPQ